MTISNTIKAAQVGKANVGELYFSVLDHSPQRGPGVKIVPPEASEGRVQLAAARLTDIGIASVAEYQGFGYYSGNDQKDIELDA